MKRLLIIPILATTLLYHAFANNPLGFIDYTTIYENNSSIGLKHDKQLYLHLEELNSELTDIYPQQNDGFIIDGKMLNLYYHRNM